MYIQILYIFIKFTYIFILNNALWVPKQLHKKQKSAK